MKRITYIAIAGLIGFFALGYCLHEYIKTKIFTNLACAHPVKTTAILYHRGVGDYCEWHVDYGDRIAVESYWDNCRRYEEGATYPFVVSNYSCQHLEKNLPVLTKEEMVEYMKPLGYPY